MANHPKQRDSSKFYGAGDHEHNPFFPDETGFEGPRQTIHSPHGSTFNMPIKDGTELDSLKGQGRKMIGTFGNDDSAVVHKYKKGEK